MASKVSQTAEGDNNKLFNIEELNASLNNISSIVAKAAPRIAEIVSSSSDSSNDTVAYEIGDKISHNNVQSFAEILDEYGRFGPPIDEIYDEYDNQDPGFKKKILAYFRSKYLVKKAGLKVPEGKTLLEAVRANADSILLQIFEEFKTDLKNSNNLTLRLEEVESCALAVTCHAFIQCKILEKP